MSIFIKELDLRGELDPKRYPFNVVEKGMTLFIWTLPLIIFLALWKLVDISAYLWGLFI